MKPDAVYIFEQSPVAHTRYKLAVHQGADIPNFPAVWVKNCKAGKAGEKYVGYRETDNKRPGRKDYSYTIEREGGHVVTGVNFTPDFPRKACGDYGPDGLLIEFSQDWKRLYMWFFRGLKEAKQSLFQSWQEGEIPEAVPDNALPVETKKAG